MGALASFLAPPTAADRNTSLRDRGFESLSLLRGVTCEPGLSVSAHHHSRHLLVFSLPSQRPDDARRALTYAHVLLAGTPGEWARDLDATGDNGLPRGSGALAHPAATAWSRPGRGSRPASLARH